MEIDKSKILIKAALVDNKYIPIWKLTYKEDEYFGGKYFDKDLTEINHLFDVYYDINKKEIYSGEAIEFRNCDESKVEIGALIFYETNSSVIKRGKVLDIEWEVRENLIKQGKILLKDYSYYCDDLKIESDKLYHVKILEPRYKIEGEKRLVWPHQLKKVEL